MPAVVSAAIYHRTDTRSKVVGAAMAEGINACGDVAVKMATEHYKGPVGDVAVFYGFKAGCREIAADYLAAGKHYLYIDLGYWGERLPGQSRFHGYHRFSVDARHPSPEIFARCSPYASDRFEVFDIDCLRPLRRSRGYVLLAGMSPNAARLAGFAPEEWERQMITKIRRVTDRPILYRPKPSFSAQALLNRGDGIIRVSVGVSLARELKETHITVSHHSNVAIDGLVAGVPCHVAAGIAVMHSTPVPYLETPWFPPDNELHDFFNGVAYWQWSHEEMRAGKPWRWLRERGLFG